MQTPTVLVYKVFPFSISVSLATIGVCVFGAVASVAALFDFKGEKENETMDY